MSFYVSTTEENSDMLTAARSGDQTALNQLIEYYEPEVRKIACKYFLPRAEYDDLIQEGRIAVYQAVLAYKDYLDTPFLHFLRMVVKRKLIDIIRKYNRLKYLNINNAYSLNNVISETEDTSFLSVLPNAEDPATEVAAMDEARSIIKELNQDLSNLERQVFEHYFLQGFKQREVSEQLGLQPKSLDNAIQRIKRKTLNYRTRQMAG